MTDPTTYARAGQVCSLKVDTPQSIPAGSDYRVVRFPFGAAESIDEHGMHQMEQPDGYTVNSWDSDDRSGLIWPSRDGWGLLYAMVQWENGDYSELRDQFVRDPLRFTSDPENTTATDHRPPSPGMQCFTKNHAIYVHPETPIALRVTHNDNVARNLVLAELKLVITDA